MIDDHVHEWDRPKPDHAPERHSVVTTPGQALTGVQLGLASMEAMCLACGRPRHEGQRIRVYGYRAAEDPEWIVTTDDEGSIDTSSEPIASTAAVRNDRVLVVDANLVSQAAPRVVEPLRVMAEAFHPEAFIEETETEAMTETATETETETDTDGDGAGFGVAVAIGALLGAAFLARRR
jgi:PGF-CTERM protein